LDEFFHLDNDKNRSNILVVVKTDKVKDYARLRQTIIDLALVNKRAKHRLVKFCAEYFFKELYGTELELAIEKSFIRNDTIKNDEDISAFIAKE